MRKVTPVESIETKKRKLCFAASDGKMTEAQSLLAQGISANCIYEGNGYTATPLECAISGNHEDMLEFLIDQGADPGLEVCGAKSYVTCLSVSDAKFEKRLSMIKILYTKKPEIAEEIATYVVRRISYLGREGQLDETINSEKSQAIIAELTQINQGRLEREEKEKELAKHVREVIGLDEATGRRKSSDEETKSGSSAEALDPDPNHKNPASKVRPNPSQSSPIVPVATNSGCSVS